jgi:hypothetical protein
MILPLLAVGAVVLLAGSLGIALYAAIPAPALQQQDGAGAARRCAACGRIESLRELDTSFAAGKAIRMREFTVRMADGSSRVFLEDAAVGWRLGERLIYIDGASGSP